MSDKKAMTGFALGAALSGTRKGPVSKVMAEAQKSWITVDDAKTAEAELKASAAAAAEAVTGAENEAKVEEAAARGAKARAKAAASAASEAEALTRQKEAEVALKQVEKTEDSKVSAAGDAAKLEELRAQNEREKADLAVGLQRDARADVLATGAGAARAAAAFRAKQSDSGLEQSHKSRGASELQAAQEIPAPIAVEPVNQPSANGPFPCKNRRRHRRDGRLLVEGVAGPRHRRDGVPARRLRY